MSLAPQSRKLAIPLMQYGVRFSELGHTGPSHGAFGQKRHHKGDDLKDGPNERKGGPCAHAHLSVERKIRLRVLDDGGG